MAETEIFQTMECHTQHGNWGVGWEKLTAAEEQAGLFGW